VLCEHESLRFTGAASLSLAASMAIGPSVVRECARITRGFPVFERVSMALVEDSLGDGTPELANKIQGP
jgi:hypothetical protein